MSDEGRLKRISELLHQEVAKIILRSFDFAGAIPTVSSVVLSPNRQQAKIYVTVFPFKKSEEVLEKLERGVASVQRELNKKLRMRPVPKVEFVLDDSEERSRKILDLIDKTE